jgi:hypothetical protein
VTRWAILTDVLSRRVASLALRGAPLVAACLVAAPCFAQSKPADDAFLMGKALMEQGRIDDACAKFDESLKLERRGGTLLNLAVCRQKQGRHATALRLLREARARALKDQRDDRIDLAEKAMAESGAKLSWLTIRVAAGADAPDLAIQVDGEDLPRASWGVLQAVDPGSHVVAATAAGRARMETTVTVGEAGDQRSVEIPAPKPEVTAETRPPADELPPAPPPSVTSAAPGARAWQKPLGATVAAVGVSALAIGAVFGVKAIHDAAASNPLCPDDGCKKNVPTEVAAYNQQRAAATAARVADVAIPLGAAAAAAGLVVLFLPRAPAAPTRSAARVTTLLVPLLTPRSGELTLRGWF